MPSAMPPAMVPSETSSRPTNVRTVKRQTRSRKSDTSPAPTRMMPKAPRTIANRTKGVYSTLAPAQVDMRGALAADVFAAFVAERPPIKALKQRLARAEQHRPHGEMQLIDQP